MLIIIHAMSDGALAFAQSPVALCDFRPRSTAWHFSEMALAPSLLFMAQARSALAFTSRRLIAPYTWAFAADPHAKVQTWEFEPSQLGGRLLSAHSEDHTPRSVAKLPEMNEATALYKAQEFIWELRRRRTLRRGLIPRGKHPVRTAVARTLVSEGLPTLLARRLAHEIVLTRDRTLEHPDVWRALGRLLRSDTDWLRTELRLTNRQISNIVLKMGRVQVHDLWHVICQWELRHPRVIMRVVAEAARPWDALWRELKARVRKARAPRSKWTLLLIAGTASAELLRQCGALLPQDDRWLHGLTLFGPAVSGPVHDAFLSRVRLKGDSLLAAAA